MNKVHLKTKSFLDHYQKSDFCGIISIFILGFILVVCIFN